MKAFQTTIQALGNLCGRTSHLNEIEMDTFSSESEELNKNNLSSTQVTNGQFKIVSEQTTGNFVPTRRSTGDLSIATECAVQNSWYGDVVQRFRRLSLHTPRVQPHFFIGDDEDESETESNISDDNVQSSKSGNAPKQVLSMDQLFPKVVVRKEKAEGKTDSYSSTEMGHATDSGNDADIEDSDARDGPRGRYHHFFEHEGSLSDLDDLDSESYV